MGESYLSPAFAGVGLSLAINENLKEQLEAKDGKIEDLEQQVWNEQEEYKNLMFTKESVDEDNYQEIDKLDKELNESKSVIKELKQKIDDIEKKSTSTVEIAEAKNMQTCQKCQDKFKTKKQLNQHVHNKH